MKDIILEELHDKSHNIKHFWVAPFRFYQARFFEGSFF